MNSLCPNQVGLKEGHKQVTSSLKTIRTKLFTLMFVMILLIGPVSGLTWRHDGTDTMSLSDVGNLNVLGNVTASWFKGIFNWIVGSGSSNYLSFNGTQLDFNESKLNETISLIDTATNTSMFTYVNAQDTAYNTSMFTYVNAQDIVYNTSMFTYVNALNVSQGEWVEANYLRDDGDTATGDYDFNGGIGTGVAIRGGSIYAQTGYFYNISSLGVTNLEINGSLFPDVDNSFDLGSGSLRWQDLFLSGDANVSGTIYRNNKPLIDWSEAMNGTLMSQATYNTNYTTLMLQSTFDSNYSTNDPIYRSWSLNYSDYLTTKAYALNDSLWTSNYTATTLTLPNNLAVAKNFSVDTSDFFVNSNTGNVGIGTTSPSANLEVTGLTNPTIKISAPTGERPILLFNSTSATAGFIDFNQNGLVKSRIIGGAVGDESLTFYTNGSNRVKIDGTGNVGIGTTAPGYKLDVVTNNNRVRLLGTTGYSLVDIQNNGGSLYVGRDSSAGGQIVTGSSAYSSVFSSQNTYPMHFAVNGAIGMTMLNGGNVGIGTTSPSKKLEVQIGADSADGINISDSGGKQIAFLGDGSSSDENGWLALYDNSGNLDVQFGASSAVNSWINNGGNVGIGTTSPGSTLHVVGDAIINGTSDLRVRHISGITSTNVDDTLYLNWITNQNVQLGNTGGNLIVNNGIINVKGTGNSYILGNVGIGTASPVGKLDVNGAILLPGSTGNTMVRPAIGAARITGEISSYRVGFLGADDGFLRLSAGGGTNTATRSYIDLSGYSTVADMNENIAFGVAGVEKMRILANGNVGIGTTSPGAKLDIQTGALRVFDSGTTVSKIEFERSSDGWSLGSIDVTHQGLYGTNLAFKLHPDDSTLGTAPADVMYLQHDGNVGIGTAGPVSKFHLVGTGSTPADGTQNSIFRMSVNGMTGLNIGILPGAPYGTWLQSTNDPGSSAGTYSLLLNPVGGNVGIGTTSPFSVLDIQATSVSWGQGISIRPDASGYSAVFFPDENNVANATKRVFFGRDQSGSNDYFSIQKQDYSGGLYTGFAMMTINLSDATTAFDGKVGIGYANPGTAKLAINGNVGIGTTTPNAPLVVNGITGAGGLINVGYSTDYKLQIGTDTGSNGIMIRAGSAGVSKLSFDYGQNADGLGRIWYNSSTNSLSLYTSATEKVTILNSGNVGIGTTAPSRKLEVSDTTEVTTFTGNQNQGLRISGKNTYGNYALLQFGLATNSIPLTQIGASFTNDGSLLQFGTSNSYAVGITNTAMTIDYNSNVGIGTTSPGNKLQVAGNTSILGNFSVDTSDFFVNSNTGNVGIGTTAPLAKLQVGAVTFSSEDIGVVPSVRIFGAPHSSSDSTLLRLIRDTNSGVSYGAGVDFRVNAWDALGSGDGYLPHTRLTIALKSTISVTETANVDVMSLLDNGNVGIGTTGPASKLQVVNGDKLSGGDGSGTIADFTGVTPTGQSSMVSIASNDAVAINTGGVLGFGGRYTGTSHANWASIKGLKADATSGNYGGYLSFFTRLNGAGSAERMRIDTNGNVGIGTSSPQNKLNVLGDANVTGHCVTGDTLLSVVEKQDISNINDLNVETNNKNHIPNISGHSVGVKNSGGFSDKTREAENDKNDEEINEDEEIANSQMLVRDEKLLMQNLEGGVNEANLNRINNIKNKNATNVASMVTQDICQDLNICNSNNYLNFSVNDNNVEDAPVALMVMYQPDELGLSRHPGFPRDDLYEASIPTLGADYTPEYKIKKVQIKDVKAGDEVLSLNEETGKIEPHKINGLLDMGIKPTFNLTTEDGRSIRTTAEHPYLVKSFVKEGDILNAKGEIINNLPLNSDGLTFSNNFDKSEKVVSINGGESFKTTIPECSLGGNNFLLRKCLSNVNITRDSDMAILDNCLSDIPNETFLTSCPFSFKSSSTPFGKFSSERNFNLFLEKNMFFFSDEFRSICHNREDSRLCEQWKIILKDFIDADTYSEQFKNLPDHNPCSFKSRSSTTDFAINNNVFININSHDKKSNKEYLKLSKELPAHLRSQIEEVDVCKNKVNEFSNDDLLDSSLVNSEHLGEANKWTKVSELKPGMEIAVSDVDKVKWVKIKSIEYVGEEQVYDIEVEGTHNFIANDIVAHNTYLGNSTTDTVVVAGNLTANNITASFFFGDGSGLTGLTTGTLTGLGTYGYIPMWNGTTSLNNSVVYQNGSNVGINTTTPQNTLNVVGDGNFTTGLYVNEKNVETGYDFATNGTFLTQLDWNTNYSTNDPVYRSWSLNYSDYLITKAFALNDSLWTSNYTATTLSLPNNLAVAKNFSVDTSDFFVNSNTGNVGIGTTSPGYRLEVNGSAINTPIIRAQASTGSGKIDLYEDGGNNPFIRMYDTYGNEDVRITSTIADSWFNGGGNVGIGTTAPGTTLDIVRANQDLTLDVVGNTQVHIAAMTNDAYAIDKGGAIGMGGIYRSDGLRILFGAISARKENADDVNANGYLSLYTYKTGLKERVRIDSNGNVGIGTTAPDVSLDVRGAAGRVNIQATTGTNEVRLRLINTGGDVFLAEESSTGGTVLTGSSAYAGVLAKGGAYPLQFGTNNAVRMTILSDGNVGIGTTSPGAKLDVFGRGIGNAIRGGDSTGGNNYIYTQSTGKIGFWASGDNAIVSSGDIDFITDFGFDDSDFGSNKMTLSNAGGLSLGTSYVGTDAGAGNMIISGNVGIGTTSPTTDLTIEGTTSQTITDITQSASGAGLAMEAEHLATGGPYYHSGYMMSETTYGYGKPSAGMFFETSNSGASIHLGTGTTFATGISNPNALVVRYDGNVGIGTTSPLAKLEVNGTANFTGDVKPTTTSAFSLGSTALRWLKGWFVDLDVSNNVTIGGNLTVDTSTLFVNSNTDMVGIGTTSPTSALMVNSSNAYGGFEVTNSVGTSRFFVNSSSGRIGIGTATPSAIFDVQGTALINTTGSGAFRIYGTDRQLNIHEVSAGGVAEFEWEIYSEGGILKFVDRSGTGSASQVFNLYQDNSASFEGNLGIGPDVTPDYKLDVQGTLHADGVASFGSNLSVDSSVFFVDSVSDRVGIGTTDLSASAGLIVDAESNTYAIRANSINGTGIYTYGNNTGIDSRGAIQGVYGYGGTIGVFGFGGSYDFKAGGSGKIGTGGTTALSLMTNDISRIYIADGGNVGIGTTGPGNKLQINAALATASESLLRLSGGSTGFSGANDAGTAYSLIFDGTAYSVASGIVQRDGAKIEMAKENTWNEAGGGAGVRGALVFYTGAGSIASPTLTEKVRITSAGNVGIGTTSPGAPLEVNGNIKLGDFLYSGGHLTIQSGTGANIYLDAGAGTDEVTILNTGNVGIGTNSPGTAKLNVSGQIYQSTFTAPGSDPMCWDGVGGSLIGDCSSLEEYKENIEEYNRGLNELMKLNPVRYDWINGSKQNVGFIAEEVEQSVPSLAKYREGNLTGYQEFGMSGLIVNAVQEQQGQIGNLDLRINNSLFKINLTTIELNNTNQDVLELQEKLNKLEDKFEDSVSFNKNDETGISDNFLDEEIEEKISNLENENLMMKKELCKKDNSYSWCNDLNKNKEGSKTLFLKMKNVLLNVVNFADSV